MLGVSCLMLLACTSKKEATVLLTSEAGEKCAPQAAIVFTKTCCPEHKSCCKENNCCQGEQIVYVNPNEKRQILDGYGVSLTEASAFVLACVSPEEREAILHELFSEEGANFSLVRTQIGASDFSVEGHYSLDEVDGDTALLHFSLDRDKEGFARERYPQIQDEHYDLYHLMKDVAAIKAAQADKEYRIVANTWTAPHWMKDNKKYYERANGWGRGGALLPEYYQTYANYLLRYLQAYRAEGIEIWAMTPVNEPMGNDGGWESMDMWPAAEADFIAHYMGPTLAANGFEHIHILGFDQNIFEMGPYTAAIYGNDTAASYTSGMALHWYGSTFSCFPEVLDSIHALYPDKKLIHTEGCIDNLGRPAWNGVTDPVGFQESGWFKNDSFWWNEEATDWAYSTPFWPELHPRYSAVQRYMQYIIDGTNHWMTGFADWNAVLDSIGGPNHVENYCGAPVMIDYNPESKCIYFTPYYYALKQLSRTVRPGDIALGVSTTPEGVHICAAEKADGRIVVTMLNKNREEAIFPLQVGDYRADIHMPANAVMTITL